MGVGVAVWIDDCYEHELSLAIGLREGWEGDRSTSNIAEWIGCVEAMRAAKGLKKEYPQATIEIYSDSQLITNQFNDKFTIKQPEFHKYKTKAKEYAKGVFGNGKEIQWIRREFNKQADKLSKEGIELATTLL